MGEFGVGVDVSGEDGAEELGVEDGVGWVSCGVEGWVDVVADGAVVSSTHDSLEAGVGVGFVDCFCDAGKSLLVDDGPGESGEVFWSADLDTLQFLFDLGEEELSLAFGDIDAGAC